MVCKNFSREKAKNLVKRLFPWTTWLFAYDINNLQYDIIAGITVGLTLVPQCVAYAQMALTRPEFGLYSGILAQFVYFLFGTSKDASIGPSAIISMLLGQVNAHNPLASEGDVTYLAILSLTSGTVLLLVAVLKLGFIVNLFSIPVINGFTTASGLAIIASQLKSFFGLSQAPTESPAVFFKQIVNIFTRYTEIKIIDVVFGLSTVTFLLSMQYLPLIVETLMKRHNQSQAKLSSEHKPSSKLTESQVVFMEYLRLFSATRNVIVFACATGAAYLITSLSDGKSNLTLVGHINSGLPMPSLPKVEIGKLIADNSTNTTSYVILKSTSQVFSDLTISIVIIPMMIMMESFAITKSLGRKNGYRIDATNELLAIGLGNAAQSFFSAFPVDAAVARCALNDQCKVKTLLSSLISAIVVILATSLLTDAFFFIPKAALAGIIMCAAYNLVDVHILKPMAREYIRDLFILVATFFLCLCFDLAYGIMIMLLVNMITFLRPIVRMKIYVRHERGFDPEKKQSFRTTIVQLSHGIKYPGADKFLDRMGHIIAKSDKHIILDCRFFSGIDYTGLQALRGFLLMAFRMNKHVVFTNMSERVQAKLQKISIDHFTYAESVYDAVTGYNHEEHLEMIRLYSRNEGLVNQGKEDEGKALPHPSSVNRLVSITKSSSHQALPYLNDHHHHHHHHRHHHYHKKPSLLKDNMKHQSHQELSRQRQSIDSPTLPGKSSSSTRLPLPSPLRPGSVATFCSNWDVEAELNDEDLSNLDEEEIRQRRSLVRNLSKAAYLYDHIPITVGNLVEDGEDSGSDIDESDTSDSMSSHSSDSYSSSDQEETALIHPPRAAPVQQKPPVHASSFTKPPARPDEHRSASWHGRHSMLLQPVQHFSPIDEDADEDEKKNRSNDDGSLDKASSGSSGSGIEMMGIRNIRPKNRKK